MAGYLAERDKAWIGVAVALGVTMIRTLSKGTIVAFLFAGLYYLLRGLKVSRKTRMWIGIASSLVLISFWGLSRSLLRLLCAREQRGNTDWANLYMVAIVGHRHGKTLAGARI